MKWIDPTKSNILFIANNLRKSDTYEVLLSHGSTPIDAVTSSWMESTLCKVIEGDLGDPVGLSGICGNRVFLLGTEALTSTASHRNQLVKHGPSWVNKCIEIANGPVHNWVYAKNVNALKYLSYLGFVVSRPAPFGPSAALFCHFWSQH